MSSEPVAAVPAFGFALRPLATGEVLGWGLSFYARNWVRFASGFLTLFFFPAAALAVPLYVSLVGGQTSEGGPVVSSIQGTIQYGSLMIGVSIGVALMLAGPAALLIAARGYLGEELTQFRAWRRLLRRLPALFVCAAISSACVTLQLQLCSFLLGVMAQEQTSEDTLVLLGMVLVALITAQSWLSVRYVLAMPVVVLEECGPFKAFARSASLFRSGGSQVYAVLTGSVAAMFLMSLPAMATMGSVARALEGAQAQDVYLQLLRLAWLACILPLVFSVLAPLYYSLRCRQDGFDLLAMALAFDPQMSRERLAAFIEQGYTPAASEPVTASPQPGAPRT